MTGVAGGAADAGALLTEVAGIALPRLAVAPRIDPLPLLIAALRTKDSGR